MSVLQNMGPGRPAGETAPGDLESRDHQHHALLVLTWLILAALVVGPAVYVVVCAVTNDPITFAGGLSLTAVRDVFATGSMLWLLVRSVLFALLIGAVATAVATALAWSTVRLEMRAERLRETLCMGTLFISPFVTAVAWVWLAAPDTGVINRFLDSIGVPAWFQPDSLSTGGMIFVMVVQYVPYAYLFVSAAMRRIDSRMLEASHLCGRGPTYTTLRVMLPVLRASLLSAVLFIGILAVGEFSVPSILGQQGSFTPLSVTVYNALYSASQNLPLAAAVSAELMIVCMVGLYLYQRTLRNGERFVSVSGRGHQSTRTQPSRLTAAVVWTLTGAYSLVTFLLPLAAIVVMSMSSFLPVSLGDVDMSFATLWDALDTAEVRTATVNTVLLAIGVPVVSLALGVVVVYLADRLRLPTARALSYVATAPMAVPGLVMGTGLLLLLIRTPLYASLPLIGIGMVSVCLTHAVRLVSNGVHQLDQSLEEASQVSGASRLRTVWSVLLPLIRPSLYSAFVLIFVLAIRELNVAVALYSPHTQVLSVVAWNYSSSALTKAAAVGLLQLVLMFAGMGVLRALFRADRAERADRRK
ncbi:iron ABC transporter permease [Streptomyces sp. NPDC023723]|uniref:ABC transporter permease n=1 Tax=Streptomyces sp. NPDC023723 TaxID=3154323 RepID=UPI0033ED6C99